MNRHSHHRTPRRLIAGLLAAAAFVGCSDDRARSDAKDGSVGDEDASFCAEYQKLATEIGCSAQQDCAGFISDCHAPARVWLACLRRDRRQCICESDGDMNCEGSFKANEGPALCIDEYTALDACFGE